jgi:hypothetical protein
MGIIFGEWCKRIKTIKRNNFVGLVCMWVMLDENKAGWEGDGGNRVFEVIGSWGIFIENWKIFIQVHEIVDLKGRKLNYVVDVYCRLASESWNKYVSHAGTLQNRCFTHI